MSNKKKYISPELTVDTYQVEMGFTMSLQNTTESDFDLFNMQRWEYSNTTDLTDESGNGWDWTMN